MTEKKTDKTADKKPVQKSEDKKPSAAGGVNESGDLFTRPSGFREEVVLQVWEAAEPGKKPDTRRDWRSGKDLGPWKAGEPRNGIWDVGHIEPWYKVVERLKRRKTITREDVINEFNNIKNLGVENPETNRPLGVNSSYEVAKEDEEVGPDDIAAALPGRTIVWDTETTGFNPLQGHRIIEIAAVELIDGKPTGAEFHRYINPDFDQTSPEYRKLKFQIDKAAKVHGLTEEFLKDKPDFGDIADDLLEFVGDAPMVAHNASFDMRFLNAELKASGKEPVRNDRKIDSLRVARQLLPRDVMQKHTLDALAEHFGVDTSEREKHHGGLIDTRILAGIFAKMAPLAKKAGIELVEEPYEKSTHDFKKDGSLYRLAELISEIADEEELKGAPLKDFKAKFETPASFASYVRARQANMPPSTGPSR